MKNQSQKIKGAVVLTLGAAFVLAFQNCGQKMSFVDSNASAQAALGQIEKSCIDIQGAEHANGEDWIVSDSSVQAVSCVDAGMSSQGYLLEDTFHCTNGEISQVKGDTKLVAPMAVCAAPTLSVSADVVAPLSGGTSNLLVKSEAVHDVAYACTSAASGNSISTGSLAVGSANVALKSIVEDINCSISAQHGDQTPIIKQIAITVDCESSGKLKDPTTRQCIEFQCKSFVSLDPKADGSYEVPARSTAGICYSVKIMNAIASGPSDLTPTVDTDFVSRNHGSGAATRNPYQMGKKVMDFLMKKGGGARQVKLSGSGNSNSSISVDNYVAVGLSKKSVGLDSVSAYKAYGSKDSTVDASSNYVLFKNMQLPFTSFATGGTSTVNALDITTQVSTEESYSLDVRALDCGGTRYLTDIYLVFQ